MKKPFDMIIKGVNILLLALSFCALVFTLFFPQKVEAFIVWTGVQIQYLGAWNYLLGFLITIIESFPFIGTVLPGQELMLLIGGFVWKNAIIPLMFCASVWAIVGNYIGYLLGVRYGEFWLKQYGIYVGLWKTEQDFLHRQMEKRGAWFIILGKFHNLTRAFLPFIAGASGMQPQNFWKYNVIGSIIWAITILLLGVVFGELYHEIVAYLPKLLILIFVGVLLYFFLFRREDLNSYLEKKEKEFDSL